MQIGKAMRRLRKAENIKQKVMARKMGISASALVAIESGKWNPKFSTIDKFCEVLNIPRVQLVLEALGWEDMPAYGADRDDLIDIIDLAKLRVDRYRQRRLFHGE